MWWLVWGCFVDLVLVVGFVGWVFILLLYCYYFLLGLRCVGVLRRWFLFVLVWVG